VGEPDGFLEARYRGSHCQIEISLVTEVYFSHKDKILLLKEVSGGRSFLEAFDLNQSCHYLGRTSLNKAQLKILSRWRLQYDGSRKCNN
jgi:hypothetical protein